MINKKSQHTNSIPALFQALPRPQFVPVTLHESRHPAIPTIRSVVPRVDQHAWVGPQSSGTISGKQRPRNSGLLGARNEDTDQKKLRDDDITQF
jgi:hypothetical protein